jgi:hypothetical protein
MIRSPYLFLGAVLTAVGLLGCADTESARPAPEAPIAVPDTAPDAPVFDVRSVTLDARRRPDPNLLARLHDLGVTHLTLVSFGWQESTSDPHVRVDTSDGWYSESHRGIRALSRQADTLGMDVILKPHLWIGGYDEGMNRSEIGFETEAQWTRWENSYRHFLMHYARLAQEIDAHVLVLGTELTSTATSRPAYWRSLADTVRSVYDGQLTYAANWHKEYQQIDFWDALDYVGIQAYFPLSKASNPSLDTLQARWRAHRTDLATLHQETGKPVLFTEIGYRSAPNAAEAPWRWPERDEHVSPDSSLQARCYRAFLSTMRNVPWFKGAIIWKWHPDGDHHPTAFTPQDKPAEAVLRRWFSDPASPSSS